MRTERPTLCAARFHPDAVSIHNGLPDRRAGADDLNHVAVSRRSTEGSGGRLRAFADPDC